MTVPAGNTAPGVAINGVALELVERGKGRPLLFLHPGHPSGRLDAKAEVLELLSERARVLAPTHPGFGSSLRFGRLTRSEPLWSSHTFG